MAEQSSRALRTAVRYSIDSRFGAVNRPIGRGSAVETGPRRELDGRAGVSPNSPRKSRAQGGEKRGIRERREAGWQASRAEPAGFRLRLKELHVKRKSHSLPLCLALGRSRGAENSRRRFHHRPSRRLGAPRAPEHPREYHPNRCPSPAHPSSTKRRLGAARCASVNPRLVWRYALRHDTVRSVLAKSTADRARRSQ